MGRLVVGVCGLGMRGLGFLLLSFYLEPEVSRLVLGF